MNRVLIAAILAVTAGGVAHLQGQGSIQWGNLLGVTQGTSPGVRAPVFGVNSADPTRQLTGNPPAAQGGFPPGNTDYGGAPRLDGTGFTMALFAGPSPTAVMAMQTALDTQVFRTAGNVGFMNARITTVPGVGVQGIASVQFRAWDNRGGTVTSWAAVMADPGVPHGSSEIFQSGALGGPDPAGGPPFPAAGTFNARSFNLVVPEPSLIALGALGLGALLLRRRK